MEVQQRCEVDMPGITCQQRDQVLDLMAGPFDVLAEELSVEHQDACDLDFFVEGSGCFDDLRDTGCVDTRSEFALVQKAFEQIVAHAFLSFIKWKEMVVVNFLRLLRCYLFSVFIFPKEKAPGELTSRGLRCRLDLARTSLLGVSAARRLTFGPFDQEFFAVLAVEPVRGLPLPAQAAPASEARNPGVPTKLFVLGAADREHDLLGLPAFLNQDANLFHRTAFCCFQHFRDACGQLGLLLQRVQRRSHHPCTRARALPPLARR